LLTGADDNCDVAGLAPRSLLELCESGEHALDGHDGFVVAVAVTIAVSIAVSLAVAVTIAVSIAGGDDWCEHVFVQACDHRSHALRQGRRRNATAVVVGCLPRQVEGEPDHAGDGNLGRGLKLDVVEAAGALGLHASRHADRCGSWEPKVGTAP